MVKGSDKKQMSFFPVDGNYLVNARVELIEDAPWFSMETSSDKKKPYRVYAILHFSLNNKELKLHIYQSKDLMKIAEYEDHLFIPFIDETCGEDSYENGRYIDLTITDIAQGTLIHIDFSFSFIFSVSTGPSSNELFKHSESNRRASLTFPFASKI